MQSPSRVLVVNGPNLNLLGTRQPDIYGSTTLAELEVSCRLWGTQLGITVETFQSNHEGSIIDRLHQARSEADAIIINPGAFTHYSYAIFDALEAIGLPVVETHISDVSRRETWRQRSVIAPACVATIYGRGIGGYRDALRHLVFRTTTPTTTHTYGPDPDQVGDLRIPSIPGPHAVVVLIHGGFWRSPWQRDLMDGLAIDLTARELATWNIEYRRGPDSWRNTLSDTATAIDYLGPLAADHHLDMDRIAVVGHSAGGHLALWTAGRARLPDESPWASGTITPRLTVALAGVTDLKRATDEHLGDDAVEAFFGGPPDPTASPSHLLPLGVPQLVAHGTADDQVPLDQSRSYVEQARAGGDTIDYMEFEGADHWVFIDERSHEWVRIASVIVERLRPS